MAPVLERPMSKTGGRPAVPVPEPVPGTIPPRSLLCAMLPQNATSRSPTNTGATTAMSIECGTPPRYG